MVLIQAFSFIFSLFSVFLVHLSPLTSLKNHNTCINILISFCSKGPIKRHFTLTNKGRRHQQLFWSTEGFNPRPLRNKDRDYNPLDVKYQVSWLVKVTHVLIKEPISGVVKIICESRTRVRVTLWENTLTRCQSQSKSAQILTQCAWYGHAEQVYSILQGQQGIGSFTPQPQVL